MILDLCRFCNYVSRDRVIAASSPGMASEQPPDGKQQAFERAVFAECLKGIL